MAAKSQSRYEIGLLVLLMAEFYSDVRVTSGLIAESAGCNPVVVRNIYSQLKAAGLLEVKPGMHGLHLARDPHDISLWDIYSAVEDASVEAMFGLTQGLSGECSLSENIHALTLEAFAEARDALRERLSKRSFFDFAWSLPDTYEETPEEKLRILGQSMAQAATRHGDEPAL